MGIQRRQLARRNGLKARKPPRKQKDGVVASLERKLDGLIRKLIWKRDGGFCQRCFVPAGDTGEVAHVHGRGLGKRLRWAPQNNILMCFDCHREWSHKHIKAFIDWFSALYPARWKFIQEHKNDIWKPTPDELEALIAEIEKELGQ